MAFVVKTSARRAVDGERFSKSCVKNPKKYISRRKTVVNRALSNSRHDFRVDQRETKDGKTEQMEAVRKGS